MQKINQNVTKHGMQFKQALTWEQTAPGSLQAVLRLR